MSNDRRDPYRFGGDDPFTYDEYDFNSGHRLTRREAVERRRAAEAGGRRSARQSEGGRRLKDPAFISESRYQKNPRGYDEYYDDGDYSGYDEEYDYEDSEYGGRSRSRQSRREDKRDRKLYEKQKKLEEQRRQEELARYRYEKKRLRQERRYRGRMRSRWLWKLIVVLIILAIPFGILTAFFFRKLDRLDRHELSNVQTYHDSGHYTNIALFGLDSRNGELTGGVRSDSIIIASINNHTKEVTLVSVYRDTYLQMSDGSYSKINAAYVSGPENAINVLNKNLDLDIEDYVAVNFNALIDMVDLLGGFDLELTAEEAYWTNQFSNETAAIHGVEPTYLPNEDGGVYHLNGIQAVAYSRIRYTAGDDFKRTERQRIVLSKIIEQAKHASPVTLNNLLNQVLPQVSTSLGNWKILRLCLNVFFYNMDETAGFPFNLVPSWFAPDGGEAVVPIGLASNVVELHRYLFDDESYQPSAEVNAINDELIYLTGIDPANY